MHNIKCTICGKDISERRLKQGKTTCCRACTMKTESYRQNRSKQFKAFWSNEEKRKEHSDKLKKAYEDLNIRQKISDSVKQSFSKNDSSSKMSVSQKQRYLSIEEHQKTSASVRSAWLNEEKKAKHSDKLKKVYQDLAIRQKVAGAVKASMTEEVRHKMSVSTRKSYESLSYRQKLSNASKSAWLDSEFAKKRYDTMKKNGTFAKSKTEDFTYQLLLTRYDKEDIERQYFDKERYPFKCDFYIKSLDLFIECHYSEFHQYEPFDNTNEEHLQRLACLQDKADKKFMQTGKESKYHKMIYTWTDLDIRKLECAKEHGLNWLAFYSLEEFERWLNENKI